MADVTLRRYKLPTNDESGWALIIIGSDGYFSAVSDHGNYAYIWGSPGCEFREFLTGCDPSYFHSKITHMRESEVWDEDAVERNVRKRLDEMVEHGLMSKDAADDAFFDAEGNLGSSDALWSWASEADLPEDFCVYEGIAAMKPEPWSWTFATKVLPRFQRLLRAELEAEAAHLQREDT